jgi:hypothetical protein
MEENTVVNCIKVVLVIMSPGGTALIMKSINTTDEMRPLWIYQISIMVSTISLLFLSINRTKDGVWSIIGNETGLRLISIIISLGMLAFMYFIQRYYKYIIKGHDKNKTTIKLSILSIIFLCLFIFEGLGISMFLWKNIESYEFIIALTSTSILGILFCAISFFKELPS